MDDLTRLAAGLDGFSRRAPRAVGAALGRGADSIRDAGRSEARSKGWSQETIDGIYSRRERQGSPAGYVFVKGPAAHYEDGTSTQPARPIVTPHLDRLVDSIVDDVADRVARGF